MSAPKISGDGGHKEGKIVVRCRRCGREKSKDQSYEYEGTTYCEDCYRISYLLLRPAIHGPFIQPRPF
jgi:hypothetical protein